MVGTQERRVAIHVICETAASSMTTRLLVLSSGFPEPGEPEENQKRHGDAWHQNDSETFSWLSAYNNALMGRRRVSGGIAWDKCKVGFITERPQRGRGSCRLSESRLFWEQ